MKITHVIITAAILLCAVVISGCTMSDADIQNYVNTHPDEIKAYVDSHGQQISTYLEEHPEILEQITLPETPMPAPIGTMVSATETTTTVEPTTIATQQSAPTTETTVIPTTTIPTTETTTISTTTTTAVPTTTKTTLPTTAPTTVTTMQVIDNTPVPTTLVTMVPEPTPYIIATTGLPLVSYRKSEYVGYTSDPEIDSIVLSMHTQYSRLDDKFGTASLSMHVKNLTYTDGHVQGVSGSGYIQSSYDFTWNDNLDGTYSISAIGLPKDQRDIHIRTIVVEPNTGYFTISGYEGITFR